MMEEKKNQGQQPRVEFGLGSLCITPGAQQVLTNEDVMDDKVLQSVRELREKGKVASVRAIRPMVGAAQQDVVDALKRLVDRRQLVKAGGRQDGYALPSGVTEEPGDNPWD